MIIGDPNTFAIESHITDAYDRLSFRALGFFVVHIAGFQYGVRKPDATMLACSLGEVEDRLSRRGTHSAPFSSKPAGAIADALKLSLFGPEEWPEEFFGLSRSELEEAARSRFLVWAPDGDEAFDDGSFIFQFDVNEHVRLIGSRFDQVNRHDPNTLREVMINADAFYDALRRWRDAFVLEWKSTRKILEANDTQSNEHDSASLKDKTAIAALME